MEAAQIPTLNKSEARRSLQIHISNLNDKVSLKAHHSLQTSINNPNEKCSLKAQTRIDNPIYKCRV
jgi:hypothetical protein